MPKRIFLMQKILCFSVLLVLSGCAANKGTKVDYISLLNSVGNCETQYHEYQLRSLNVATPLYTVVGGDSKCGTFENGQSFYKSFETNKKVNRVTIRSFYGTSGETAKLFFPEVAALSSDGSSLTAGIVEEIVDDFTTADGNYLLITYLFNKPINKFVVYTDSSQFKGNYNYNTRNSSAMFVGGAVIPFDFTHNFQISYNAGGPIEVLAN